MLGTIRNKSPFHKMKTLRMRHRTRVSKGIAFEFMTSKINEIANGFRSAVVSFS